MINSFVNFQTLFNRQQIKTINKSLDKIYQNYKIHLIMKPEDFSKINDIKNETKIIIINEMKYEKEIYYFICFEQTIIIISESNISFLKIFFNNHKNSNFISLSNDNNEILSEYIRINEPESKEMLKIYKSIVSNERSRFLNNFSLRQPTNAKENKIWQVIRQIIICFIVKKSYSKINNHRLKFFEINEKFEKKDIEFNNNNYIKIDELGVGNSHVQLVCHIELEQLFALKLFHGIEGQFLSEREKRNYTRIHHPLIPKYYGTITVDKKEHLLIEYIKGSSLDLIEELHLNESEKISIIFEIMKIIEYLHNNKFIYRDLKPNNFIIDENKTIVLIDFDRMLTIKEEQNTNDFSSIYVAPEVNETEEFSYEVDIYSLGLLFYFIIMEKDPPSIKDKKKLFNQFPEDFYYLIEICEKCTKIRKEERPTIRDLLDQFLNNLTSIPHVAQHNQDAGLALDDIIFKNDIQIPPKIKETIFLYSLAASQNDPEGQYNLGVIYDKGEYVQKDINKAIYYYLLAVDQNHPQAQFKLGLIYDEGEYVPRNINKALYYYSLAADQNNSDAQINLGVIYDEGEYVPRNINKAIHYYSLAADQNNSEAQFNLGVIYDEGEHVQRDIKKAIHYYSRAADQNHPDALYNLGLIYDEDEEVPKDINKVIHYYTLAAEQNNPLAQFNLGLIYHDGEYILKDVKKAIHYYSLAADHNISQAQYNLGVIYNKGEYVQRDIKKAIHYYTLAAESNDSEAQFSLGLLYDEGEYVKRDISKAIYYYSLAADQNHCQAQFNLGFLYNKGEYVQKDIDKAIHYYSLAAHQNHPQAQFNLGVIYDKGEYVPKDINKAIYYYSLASDQNHPKAQFNLAVTYDKGEYIQRNINKAIHYYSLAADQNISQAQFNLGLIYDNGEYVRKDINKAIYYYSLAADQNDPKAQFNLGVIYNIGEYVPKDINKAIHYYLLAANKNHPEAQFIIGTLYYEGIYFKQYINVAIRYFTLSAKRNYIRSHFVLGVIYSQGIQIERNIEEAIYHYKNGSNLRDSYSKNNLGIIYKDEKYKNNPKEYFEESIQQKNDRVSMYNLGHIYFYGEKVKQNIERAIELFINSSLHGFKPSTILLSLAIVKKIDEQIITKEIIDTEMHKYKFENNNLLTEIYDIIQNLKLENETLYNELYVKYKKIDFSYDIYCQPIETTEFYSSQERENEKNKLKNKDVREINKYFYEGLGFEFS